MCQHPLSLLVPLNNMNWRTAYHHLVDLFLDLRARETARQQQFVTLG